MKSAPFLLLLFVSGYGFSQQSAYVFKHLSTSDNLRSQNYNWYVKKDHKGFVWISSGDGLSRYDGKNIKRYPPKSTDSTGTIDPELTSHFFEGNENDMWFSSAKGINRYIRKFDAFEHLRIQSGNQTYTQPYYLLHVDTLKNTLWLRIEDTLFIHSFNSPPNKHKLRKEYPLSIRSKIVSIPQTNKKLLFVPDKNVELKLHTFQNETEYGAPKSFLPGFRVSCIHYEGNNTCWLGSLEGLIKLHIKTGDYTLYNYYHHRKLTDIVGVEKLGRDSLIVASKEQGIFIFNKAKKVYSQISRLSEEGISPFLPKIDRISFDEDGTLWVSATGKGLYTTNLFKKRFQTISPKDNFEPSQNSSIRSITEDEQGNFWVLGFNGVHVLDSLGADISKSKLSKDVNNSFKNLPPYFIQRDSKNRIWVAMQNGLFVSLNSNNKREFVRVRTKGSNIGKEQLFLYVVQLSDEEIITGSSEGIYRVIDNQDTLFIEPVVGHIKEAERYTWVHEQSDKKFLFVTNLSNSIQVYHRFSSEELKLIKSIPFIPKVNAFIEDTCRRLVWLPTPEGLFKLRLDSESFVIELDTLFPFTTLNAGLLDDLTGDLWISTNRGLICYSPDSVSWQIFGITDGLQADEFNYWSAYKTQSGKMIFGGVNGLNMFRPSEIKPINVEAHPVITSLLINDQSPRENIICEQTGASNLSLLQRIVLPYKQNTLSFRFAPLEYSDPDANLFRYRMLPEEQDWIESGNENFTRYPNLSPGVHTFELQATNSDQIWSQKTARLHIEITPPWYETWWFRTLVILVGLFIIYSSYRIRVSHIQRQAEVKNRMALFQQKEAEYKQLVAETETAVLRLQMNPHFIFNSMNSIHSYILEKDMDTASTYLNCFADLMRKILDNGARGIISIAQEIELLEMYMDTEGMRFENKFAYKFSISQDLDPDEVAVPTMILQPFVENSILHGIRLKEGKGFIDIKFWEEENRLHCTITDDGIGREAAKGNSQHTESHESKAIAITQGRLNLLESEEGIPPSINIQDLYDEQGLAMGTKVHIILPLL